MTEVLLFHHVQGLTDGVRALADRLRADGVTVRTPDLFEGRTFGQLEEGLEFARSTGFDELRRRGLAAAEDVAPAVVHAGISFGVTIAQALAQTRPGARGALLLESCLPVTEFSPEWPAGVPVQVHGNERDEFFDEDLPAAQELVRAVPGGELFLYPGDQHLFTDSSLASYDRASTELVVQRVRAFLAAL
jgi:dienelactone hydrolase